MRRPTVEQVIKVIGRARNGDSESPLLDEPGEAEFLLHAARAVLALFEPETVATAAELVALPVGSVVRSERGDVFEHWGEGRWAEVGYLWSPTSEDITLPAVVLDRPESEDR
jgi:hypothetical protein